MLGCIALISYICLTHGPDSFVCHQYLIVGISRGVQHIHIILCHIYLKEHIGICPSICNHIYPFKNLFSVSHRSKMTLNALSYHLMWAIHYQWPWSSYAEGGESNKTCYTKLSCGRCLHTTQLFTMLYVGLLLAFFASQPLQRHKRVDMEGLPSWTHDHSTIRELEEPGNQVDNKNAHLWWGILSYIQYKQSCARAKGRGCATAWGSVHQPLSYLAAGTYKSPWCNTNSVMWVLTVCEMRTATWREGMMKDEDAWHSPSLG